MIYCGNLILPGKFAADSILFSGLAPIPAEILPTIMLEVRFCLTSLDLQPQEHVRCVVSVYALVVW